MKIIGRKYPPDHPLRTATGGGYLFKRENLFLHTIFFQYVLSNTMYKSLIKYILGISSSRFTKGNNSFGLKMTC